MNDRDLQIAYINDIKESDWKFDGYSDDEIIAFVSWEDTPQCAECQAYFDRGDGTDDERFCSDECQQEFKINEKPVKRHNLFNV